MPLFRFFISFFNFWGTEEGKALELPREKLLYRDKQKKEGIYFMVLYTDGACSKNGTKDAVAGWAYVLLNDAEDTILHKESGRIESGTNNIGEMTAIIQGIKGYLCTSPFYSDEKNLVIYTDSNYCLKGIEEWSANWKKNDWWRDAAKTKTLKNKELWIKLDKLKRPYFSFKKVKGHSGDKWNEYVDKMAVKETK